MADGQPQFGWQATNRLSLITRQVEIYLESGALRGLLKSAHPRLSDHLRDADESLMLEGAVVMPYRSKEPLASGAAVLVQKRRILFAVDLEAGTGMESMRVARESRLVVVSSGPFWLRGEVHLPVGGELRSYFESSAIGFVPLTSAIVVGRETAAPRTLLVNLALVGAVTPLEASATQPA
jgi:hypothetical protein